MACRDAERRSPPERVDSGPVTGTLKKGYRSRAKTVPSFASVRVKEANIVIIVLLLFAYTAATIWECVSIIGLSSIGVFVGSTLDLGTAGRLVSVHLPPVKSLD